MSEPATGECGVCRLPTPAGVEYHRTCKVRALDKWDAARRRSHQRYPSGQFRQAAKVTDFTMSRFEIGRGPRALTLSEGMAVGRRVHAELAESMRRAWRRAWPEAARLSDEQVEAARRAIEEVVDGG